jgi:hypothetical protein
MGKNRMGENRLGHRPQEGARHAQDGPGCGQTHPRGLLLIIA